MRETATRQTQGGRGLAALSRRLHAALARPSAQILLTLLGGGVFVLGLFAFVMFQTQMLFTDNVRLADISPGLIPRNDGGILFGAVLVGAGLATMLFALSPRPLHRRLLPALAFGSGIAALLFSHFTIYVNAFILPRLGGANIRASFLFHDTVNAIPIATFILAFLTAFLILVVLLSGLALVTPAVWRDRILHPKTIHEHRTRLVLLCLLLLATCAAFARQFLAYAVSGDTHPETGFLANNVTLFYYLLGAGIIGALGVLTWRTFLLGWGDLRMTRSLTYRRNYSNLTTTETWIWSVLLTLNLTILMAGPAHDPVAGADRVFAVNSRGASLFFFVVAGLYAVHRRLSSGYLRFLRVHPNPPKPAKWDALFTLAVLLITVWVFFALALLPSDLTPLTQLLVRIAAVAFLLPFFAIRLDMDHFGRPTLRGPEAPYILLASCTLALLAGIMLWGIGNTVVTRYSQTGGFVTPELTLLQPYAVGIRLLGSLFLAFPITLALWFIATRHHPTTHPGPLLVAFFSIVIGLNMILTINAADPRDVAMGRTDVLIGFSIIGLKTAIDRAFFLGIWVATATMGFLATALLVHRGAGTEDVRPPVVPNEGLAEPA